MAPGIKPLYIDPLEKQPSREKSLHLPVNSMSQSTPLQTPSANLKNAICWLSETVHKHPEKKRDDILAEAELRFDLTPAECEFLNSNFKSVISERPCS